MKTTVKIEQEIDIKYVKVHLPVRYNDEDMPYDFPLRDGDWWDALIDIDLGKIIDWPQGKTGSFYMKVCDEGSYYLLDANHKDIAKIEVDYVPNQLLPPRNEYGDYVNLKIDETGIITNWYSHPSFENFFPED
jgi:hypothetical protein